MTESLSAAMLGAFIVFATTNVDDLVLLSLFFADPQLRAASIIIGQFAGISLLVLASVLAGWAAVSVPPAWVALLGLMPLALGLYKGFKLLRGRRDHADAGHERSSPGGSSISAEVMSVAGTTLANGGDNLSVYIPLFASKPASIPIYSLVFAITTALWCVLGFALVRNPVFGAKLRRYGQVILPVVLIGLGIHILMGAL